MPAVMHRRPFAILAAFAVAFASLWPLVSAEGYTGTWSTLLSQQNFEATIFTAAGLSGWASVVPFLGCLAVAGGLAWAVTPRRGLSFASLATAGAWLGAWALLAVLAPSALGIDRASERVAFNGGDRLAMFGGDGPHPISGLVLIALAFGLLTLLAALAASHAARWRRTRVSAIPAGGA